MTFSKFNRIFFIGLLFILVYLAAGCVKKEDKSIFIGAVLPLTGSSAQYGKWQSQGIDMAKEDILKSDGIEIRVKYEDSRSDPNTGVAAFQHLANQKPLCIITGLSGVVLAIAPIASRLEIPQINTSAQNPKIKDTDIYTISLINLAGTEMTMTATYARKVLNLSRVSIIHSNLAAGTGAAEQFKSVFTSLGGEILAVESYDDNMTDFRPQIVRAFSLNPQGVFLSGVSMNMARVIKQASEMGYKTQWISYSGFEGPEVETIAGKAANGIIFSSTELDTTHAPEFVARYYNKYGQYPELYASTAYDAVYIIYEAYKSGARNGKEIARYLTSGQFNYHGMTGRFTIDSTGVAKKPVIFKVYNNGKFFRALAQLSD